MLISAENKKRKERSPVEIMGEGCFNTGGNLGSNGERNRG